MPRKLKTYVTTSGFFELAVAAPSMKAATEIWGGSSTMFQRGFASETHDPKIVQATMEKPGLVLRRGVGSKGAFSEHAVLPKLADLQKALKHKPAPAAPQKREPPKHGKKVKQRNAAEARQAAKLYDLAEKRREREEARAAAEAEKLQEKRDRAIEKAWAALDAGRAAHDQRMAAIAEEREALDRKAQKEEERWAEEKERLETALERARE